MVIGSCKYPVSGESTEVPASTLDDNDNLVHRTEENRTSQSKRRVYRSNQHFEPL